MSVTLLAWLATFAPLRSGAQPAPQSPRSDSSAPKDEPTAEGTAADVSVALDASGRQVQVAVTAVEAMSASDLTLYRYQGATDSQGSTPSKVTLPALSAGQRAVRTLPVGQQLVGDTGLSAAVAVGDRMMGSGFVAVRPTGGRVVSAATMGGLDEAELEADRDAGRLTAREFHRDLAELHVVPGSESSKVTKSQRLAADGEVTVTGRATYVFRDTSVHPTRGAKVQLKSCMYDHHGPWARVSDNGDYTITGVLPSYAGDCWRVELIADAEVVEVHEEGLSGGPAAGLHFASTASRGLEPGDVWTDADFELERDTDLGHAFAILDAGRTVGAFYEEQWDSRLVVTYPSDKSQTSSTNHIISIEGGIDRYCGSGRCEEDAFDWEVLAHEAGHVVSYRAGIHDSPGGSHSSCDDLWSDGRSKEDAAKLAWSEGWATFWGMVALQTEGVPSSFTGRLRDISYDDLPGPPHFEGGTISYSLEDGHPDHCDSDDYAKGDSNELAVAAALWDVWDDADDYGETTDWTTSVMFDRLWDSDAKTFWAAWQALSSGWTFDQRRSGQIILSANGYAPAGVAPYGQLTRCPERFSWERGGPFGHQNDDITLNVTTLSGAPLTTKSLANKANGYTPSLAEWKQWSTKGSVYVSIGGRQSGSPYGQYHSTARKITLVNPPNTSGCTVGTDWDHETDWSTSFTADQTRLRPANQIDFAGHPLDVTFDNTGAVWGIGEFGLQATRTSNGVLTKHNLPIKVYLTHSDEIKDWTKPFTAAWFRALTPDDPYASGSDLAESIVSTGSSVWAAYGGEQNYQAVNNHSILARYPTDDPHNYVKWCAVPLPGDNNEVIGLAFDSKRNRVWFVESEGDHRQGAVSHTTIGWVKEAGLGGRCQNELDFGGDPRLTRSQNDTLRASAQQTVNSLQCTTAQQSDPDANCVHIIGGTGIPSGGTHIEYDAGADALWMTNWFDRKLRKYSIATGTWTTYAAPAPTTALPVAWQVATNGTHVFFNEYEGNRILRFTKSTGEWSIIELPVANNVETHSIALSGSKLWFTISDEDYDLNTEIGNIDLASWDTGARGVHYSGWQSLPMHPDQKPGNEHSFRGIDVGPGGRIALADHGDMATVILTPK